MDEERTLLPVEVVIPLRWDRSRPADVTELGAHLHWLSTVAAGVTVVDGSRDELVEEHRTQWDGRARVLRPCSVDQLWPAARVAGHNGKVVGAFTGVVAARHELVVIADDDVRHTAGTLRALVAELADADLVRPMNVFDRWPWPARWDGARSLVNRALATDWPGTFALRRASLVAIGGWSPDVLFENLELWRTVQGAGGRVRSAPWIVVPRRPPSSAQFWSQRVRQAYDDLAQPGRLVAELALWPLLVGVGHRLGGRGVAVLTAASMALAEVGRRRLGRELVPALVSCWAPLWVLERATCVWVAVGYRIRGGVPYAGRRIRIAAHPDPWPDADGPPARAAV